MCLGGSTTQTSLWRSLESFVPSNERAWKGKAKCIDKHHRVIGCTLEFKKSLCSGQGAHRGVECKRHWGCKAHSLDPKLMLRFVSLERDKLPIQTSLTQSKEHQQTLREAITECSTIFRVSKKVLSTLQPMNNAIKEHEADIFFHSFNRLTIYKNRLSKETPLKGTNRKWLFGNKLKFVFALSKDKSLAVDLGYFFKYIFKWRKYFLFCGLSHF